MGTSITANLFTTVMLEWQDERGHYHECEVEVDYTCDGEDVNVTKLHFLGNVDSISDDEIDDQVHDAVMDIAHEAYAEWMADYGEYLSEQAADRRAA